MSTATKQPNEALFGIYIPELKGRETVLEKRKLDPDPPTSQLFQLKSGENLFLFLFIKCRSDELSSPP